MSTSEVDFFFAASASVIEYETIEITHPELSKSYRAVNNKAGGLVAQIEGGATVSFDHGGFSVDRDGARTDLDQDYRLTVGKFSDSDGDDALAAEIDRIAAADGFSTMPSAIYRTFRSDDLSAPMFGPVALQITQIDRDSKGAARLTLRAPWSDIGECGEFATAERFPQLRALL